MNFRILGPLEVVENGHPLPLGRGRERALLALLLLHANEVVSADVLIDRLWPDGPPATASKSLQVYVSRLRKRLGSEVLVTRPPGYALVVRPEQLDSARFETLLEEARSLQPVEAASRLREALSLWRGRPLVDVAYASFAQAEIARLEELRLVGLEERIEADLALARHAELVGELEALVATHPLRERLRAQLMLALYRSGRQAEALDVYRDGRRVLTDELGLEPGEQLKTLERRILEHDHSLEAPTVLAVETGRPRRRLTRRRVGVLAAGAALAAAGAAVAILELGGGSSAKPVVATPGSVAVVDPHTNRVVSAVRVQDRPTRIAVYGDAVWVLHPTLRTLTRMSRGDRRVVRTVGLGGAPSALAADRHGVWVSDARTAALTLIEPERLSVVRTIETRRTPVPEDTGDPPTRAPGGGIGVGGDAGQLAIGYGSLWLAGGGSTIVRVDPERGVVMARIPDVETGESLGGLAFGAGSVWVAGPNQTSPVTRIAPRRGVVTASIPLQKYRANGIAYGGNGVWVSDVGSDQVWRIDPGRNAPVGSTKVGGQPLGVAYGAGSIWVANSGDGTLSRIDPVSGRVVRTITVGGSPNDVVATPTGVWVTID